MQKFIIKINDSNQTVFKFLKKVYSTTPLSVIYKWFRKKDLKLNGNRIDDKNIILKTGDELIVYDSNKVHQRIQEKVVDCSNLKVEYEDENILIVNKPANVEMHTDFNVSLDQMVRAYLIKKQEYDPSTAQSFVVSHVHRLDKLTSGLVIYAKNKLSLDILLEAIQNKDQIEKYYLCRTKPSFKEGFLAKGWLFYDQNLKKSIYQDKIISGEVNHFKTAITEFEVLERNQDYSLVQAKLITGRKHQIRATLSFYNYPILNDFKYGGKKLNNEKMIFLKAYKLTFKNLKSPLDYLNEFSLELDHNFN